MQNEARGRALEQQACDGGEMSGCGNLGNSGTVGRLERTYCQILSPWAAFRCRSYPTRVHGSISTRASCSTRISDSSSSVKVPRFARLESRSRLRPELVAMGVASSFGTTVAQARRMRTPLLRHLGIVAAAALSGCTFASQFTALREPPHPPVSRPPSQIEIFASGPPSRPHADVGLLYVRVLGGWDAQIQAIREAASEHGCDAVMLNWSVWGATCIMYTGPEVEHSVWVVPPPPPPFATPGG